jgi:hypothetical protein
MESAAVTFEFVRSDAAVRFTRSSACGRFSTGIEQLPDAPSTQRLGRFCDGIARADGAVARVGRFSTGIERSETPAMLRVGSFADGYERTPRR